MINVDSDSLNIVSHVRYSLDGHRVDDAAHLEAALFELHHRCVVDARALREYQDWWIRWIGDVRTQTLRNGEAILRFGTFEPDVRRCSGQGTLQDAQQAAVTLADLVLNVWFQQ